MQAVNNSHQYSLNTNPFGPTTSHDSLYSSYFIPTLATQMDSLASTKPYFDNEYLTFTSGELQNGQFKQENFAQVMELPTNCQTDTFFDSEYLTFATSELQNGQLKPTNFAQGNQMPTKCVVCGCKTFFRRSLVSSKTYTCKLKGTCTRMIGMNRCRACRFDRCILVGMNPRAMQFPTSVNMAKLFDKVSNRRTGPVFEETIEDKIIQSLVYVELKVRQIRESFRWLSESIMFRSIRVLLESNHENVLAHADQYPKEQTWPLAIDEALKLEATDGRPNWLMLDMFLCIEMGRTMPVFSQLDYNDQEALLKHAILANTLLLEAFYSYQMKSETFIMPSGYLPIKPPKDFRRKGITDRMNLISCRAMEAISRIQMTMEEFVLLKAVIYSHPAIHGVSERGRVLLETESVRYSKTLMKHLQSRMGAAPGAKKYAEIVYFVGCLFHCAQELREIHVYISTVLRSPFCCPPYMETIMPVFGSAIKATAKQWEITSRHNSTLYHVHISGLFSVPHTIAKLTQSYNKEHSSAKVFGLNTQV
ncbi:ligand-binding domain of nuclear hormone receptor domain-containing protein [Ditylenchus destructor]|nr:ligand-binding domain of nuclear hormone receptor domain-containing protein [Ditylenchus destructor]